MSNWEGEHVFGENWTPMCEDKLNAFLGLLFLAGVYRSAVEATYELWDFHDGRQIFCAVMSRQRFHDISQVLRFDDKTTRSERRNKDRLTPIREVFDMWGQTLSKSRW
jgi:hypothetical protein